MTNINKFCLNINRFMRSIIYRLILLVYGIILALLFPTLSIYVYITLFCLYFIYIILYLAKSHLNAITRTIVDLVFIAICIWEKPVDNICTIAMLFLPVANAINHTGRGKHSYVYILGLIVIYLGMLLLGNYDNFIIQVIYSLVAFSAFSLWSGRAPSGIETMFKDTVANIEYYLIKKPISSLQGILFEYFIKLIINESRSLSLAYQTPK